MQFLDNVLHIGEVSAPELAARFGSPLYAYDSAVIRRQISRVKTAFASLPLTPFYAIKANGNLAILRMMLDAGLECDAVSPGEVFLARQAGFGPERIWFTCSNVSDQDLLAIGDRRIVVNINSMSELDRCIRLRLTNPMAIRVNPDVGAGHHRDVVTGGYGVKFGLDLAEVDAARGLAESAGLRVVGLHAHIGSGITEVDPLIDSARTVLNLIDGWSDLRWVNFGGGMAVPYKPGEKDFPIDEYGARLHALAAKTLHDRGLTAIIEPGRYLVAQSGTLLSQVTAKRVSGGTQWIGVDTGFNHLARPSRYGAYHHILNASRGTDIDLRENFSADHPRPEVIVAGNICESGDVFTRDQDGPIPRSLPPFREGDILAFCDVGAYGYSMASHYNARLFPAEVMINGKEAVVIRERQSYEDLMRGQATLAEKTV
jgi:diaminopimelate decarboxylase